jgi:hypothetical protein
LNPALGTGTPGTAPILTPVPRRDSVEVRGRANTGTSLNGGEPHGLERVIESLKMENGEFRKTLRELDDRCMFLAVCY